MHALLTTIMKTKLMWSFLFGGITLFILFYWTFTYSQPRAIRKHVKTLSLRNPNLFPVFLAPTQICTGSAPHVVILVTSYVGHVELRSAHRRAMPQTFLDSFNATRIFLLAQIPTVEKYITQNAIDNEHARFDDILQGSFVEHYHNLTYKHLMGLNWAGTNCGRSKYIVKVDDDTVFTYKKIHSILGEYEPNEVLLTGYLLNGTRPHREPNNKWYVSIAEYPYADYPPYLSGWLYITTPSTAVALVSAAAYHPYFWIDDIFITGILAEDLNIRLKKLPKNIWLEYYELMECCLRDMIEKKIKCDYAIAPNGGRNNLILEFNEALKLCDASNECQRSSAERSLRTKCVVEGERRLFGSGQPQLQVIHLR